MHLATKIRLQELADLCGMSRYHFLRLFKEAARLSPHKYVTERKFRSRLQVT
jgi:AraC family transcriptional regulator